MNNIKLRLLGLIMSTILVFSLFVFGIVYYFVPRSSNKQLESLTDYVTYLNKHNEHDNEFIGKYIINNKLDYYKKEFNKLEEINTNSLREVTSVTNKYIHNGPNIDDSIYIGNNLLIQNSLITNITFTHPDEDRTLTINNSIVGINVENLQATKGSNISININNSFIYLQATHLIKNSGYWPHIYGYINNSLIGNRIEYEEQQEPFYFVGKNRGELIKSSDPNLIVLSSYYDLIK